MVAVLACTDERMAIVDHSSLAFNHGVVLELVMLAFGLASSTPHGLSIWQLQEHVKAMFLLQLVQLS